jgi:DNA-binding beta-propeller fold protein YncE
VDTLNTRVQVFDSEGKFIRSFGSLGDAPGTFTRPKGVGIDSDGNIHVADAAFDNIQIFSPEGTFLGFYGAAGLNPGFSFSLPTGVYIDENDKIYVVDQANSRVQLFQYLSEKWKKEHPTELENYRKLQEEEIKKLAEKKKKPKK